MREAVKVSNDSPVLLDRFLNDAIEVDVDAWSTITATARTSSSAASWSTSSRRACIRAIRRVRCRRSRCRASCRTNCAARRSSLAHGLDVVGLMNVQFAIQFPEHENGGKGVVYVLEVNPRASRTVPYVSKATGRPLAKIAARCMVGQTLAEQGVTGEIVPPYFAVKEAVFPFIKFPGVDPILGPEMKSTGEVMGVGESFGEAFLKSQLAAGVRLPDHGNVFVSVKNADKAARARCRPHAVGTGLPPGRDARHRGGARRRRLAGDAGQQGGRRAAAHRRHDRQRRDRAHRQHRRGKAQRDPGQLRHPPCGAQRPGADLHDARRRPRRGDRHAGPARAGTLCDPGAASALASHVRRQQQAVPTHAT